MSKEQKHQKSVCIHPPAAPDETIAVIASPAERFPKCQVMQRMKRYLAIWPTFNYPWQWETGIVEIIKIHSLSSNLSFIVYILLLWHQALWKHHLEMMSFDAGFISFCVPCPPNRENNRKPYFIFLSSGPNKNFGS